MNETQERVLAQILEDYRVTGVKPLQVRWFDTGKGCCAQGVAFIRANTQVPSGGLWKTLVGQCDQQAADIWGVSKEFAIGVRWGFDNPRGSLVISEGTLEGFEVGVAAAKALGL